MIDDGDGGDKRFELITIMMCRIFFPQLGSGLLLWLFTCFFSFYLKTFFVIHSAVIEFRCKYMIFFLLFFVVSCFSI